MGFGGVGFVLAQGIHRQFSHFVLAPVQMDLLAFPGFCQVAQKDLLDGTLLMERGGQQIIYPV